MALRPVTDQTFKLDVLDASHSKPVLVDLWAEWCGPCHRVAPLLEELALEYADMIDIVKLNTDENPEIARAYQVMSIPSLFMFKNGLLINALIGARPKSALASFIEQSL